MNINIRIPNEIAFVEIEDIEENFQPVYRHIVDELHKIVAELRDSKEVRIDGIVFDIVF